jgi:hypothetical protein
MATAMVEALALKALSWQMYFIKFICVPEFCVKYGLLYEL